MSATDGRATILCIDDDFETSSLIAEELEDRGFNVVLASSGQQALSLLPDIRPDLVLSDISMPSMSGFEVLENFARSAPHIARTPFVFLTAMSDRETELKGRRLGADDYVSKPIDFDLLHAIIDVRLRGGVRFFVSEAPLHELNEREVETLLWAARGKTSDEIASIMSITKRTVDYHLDNARNKLGVATRIEAAVKATLVGLIEP
ncbi:DNA-binding response regulator [Methylosinus sp. R-45379]|uniref:response regulator transcription factor n=1 Tax=unclassified Methylosinus TaxID=2624500 RepID=UPI000467E812|nr:MULTISPECIES: response regulator transcription factor [unclassified Methylosinus]OAI27837.1 DNA-binding response regulator [Methylosinus sp. R-45379]